MAQTSRVEQRRRRHRRIRRKVSGTAERPRMAIAKSNTALAVQFVDDAAGVTLVGVRTRRGEKTVAAARELGIRAATAALEKGIARVVVDRGGYPFHGRVKAIVDAAVEHGLTIASEAPAGAGAESGPPTGTTEGA